METLKYTRSDGRYLISVHKISHDYLAWVKKDRIDDEYIGDVSVLPITVRPTTILDGERWIAYWITQKMSNGQDKNGRIYFQSPTQANRALNAINAALHQANPTLGTRGSQANPAVNILESQESLIDELGGSHLSPRRVLQMIRRIERCAGSQPVGEAKRQLIEAASMFTEYIECCLKEYQEVLDEVTSEEGPPWVTDPNQS